MGKTIFDMCFKMGCPNPVVARPDEIAACGRHGGETRIVWSIYKDGSGWLSDNDTVIEWTFNVDEARWFASDDDAVELVTSGGVGSDFKITTPDGTIVGALLHDNGIYVVRLR